MEDRLTNAMKVRLKSTTELAKFMDERNACLRPNLRTEAECETYSDCETCWLDWLLREAET